jgi:hypothetical protein
MRTTLLYFATLLAGLAQSTTYTSDGTFTLPRLETAVIVEAWGGGGGGGGGDGGSANGAGGGGGGAYAKGRVTGLTPGTGYTVDVGALGTGGSSGSQGTAGANSTFNTTSVVAEGGRGGTNTGHATSWTKGGQPGLAANSTGNIATYNGGWGVNGRTNTAGRGGWGGSSAGTAAAGITNSTTALWQSATFPSGQEPAGAGVGGNGGNANGASGSAPASGNGGGGGGAAEGTTSGGNGTVGKIIVYRVRKFNTT